MIRPLLPAPPAPKPAPVVAEPAERVATLNANDRCDQCNVAQARVAVDLPEGRLLFCKHHYEEHEPALLGIGTVLDERWTLA